MAPRRPAARARRLVVVSFIAIGIYVAIAVVGFLGFLPDYQARIGTPYQPPGGSLALILGTDIFGRSVLYKILAGTKTAILIGLLVPSIAVPVGVALSAPAPATTAASSTRSWCGCFRSCRRCPRS